VENYGEYGMEAELAVLNYMQERSAIDIRHHNPNGFQLDGRTIKVNRVAGGDIAFEYPGGNVLTMNVVRGTWVAHKSFEKFKGNFYCLFPEGDISDPSKGKVITKKTLVAYRDTCKKNQRKDEILNGKPGYRYKNIQACMTLENFTVHIAKMIIMNYTYGTKEFYTALREPFIKDYKRSKGYV